MSRNALTPIGRPRKQVCLLFLSYLLFVSQISIGAARRVSGRGGRRSSKTTRRVNHADRLLSRQDRHNNSDVGLHHKYHFPNSKNVVHGCRQDPTGVNFCMFYITRKVSDLAGGLFGLSVCPDSASVPYMGIVIFPRRCFLQHGSHGDFTSPERPEISGNSI